MTQINLSTKQKQAQRHGEQTCDCQGERGWIGSLELYRMDEQGSSAVQHRALYSIAYDKSEWENIKNNICITESLCYMPETNKKLLINSIPILNKNVFNIKKDLFMVQPLVLNLQLSGLQIGKRMKEKEKLEELA